MFVLNHVLLKRD